MFLLSKSEHIKGGGDRELRPNLALFDHCQILGEGWEKCPSEFYEFYQGLNLCYTFDGTLLGRLGDESLGVGGKT